MIPAKLGKNGINMMIKRENDYVLAQLIRNKPTDKNAKMKVVKITSSRDDAISWLEETQ